MKTLFTAALLVIFLQGCAAFQQSYDNNEYELLSRLETTVNIVNENCDDQPAVKTYIPTLEYDARLLKTYTFYIPANTDVYGIASILTDDVAEFKKQYEQGDATPTYCTLKTQLFLSKVRIALDAVANKPR